MVGSRPLWRIFSSVPDLLSAAANKMCKRHSHHVDHYALSDDNDCNSQATKRVPTPMSDVLHYNEYTYSEDSLPTHTTGYFAIPNTPAELSRDTLITNGSLPGLIPVTVEVDTVSEEVILDEDIFDNCDLRYIMQRLESVEDANEGHVPRKRTAGDRPLLQWRVLIDPYLTELLRLEGRGVFTDGHCARCRIAMHGGYRCEDCHNATLHCAKCIVETRGQSPLHCVQVWNGQYFEKIFLKSLGLCIQLGHVVGEICIHPIPTSNDDFTILDINGIHEVGLSFCGCETAQPQYVQLLRNRFFPATSVKPKTAGTFRLLEHYHLLSTQSKVSAYNFYTTLSKRTDNTGTNMPRDRYFSFLTMTKEWRHLKMLKRAGRGHDPSGAAGTQPGECALDCPACPLPGKNLPRDWQNAPPGTQWLYKLFLGIDANFHLKRKKVSSEVADPGLSNGYAYFVNNTEYKVHLATHDKGSTTLDDTNKHCNTHDAIKLVNIKGSALLPLLGVATVDCSRREIKCPWREVRSVPKFHINAHREFCQLVFSPYLLLEFARYDGEDVERRWALTNLFASITKEMGPGSWQDMLDDAFGTQNWNKIITMARTLLTRIKTALPERTTHTQAFQEFLSSLDEKTVTQWEAKVQEWEADPMNAPNPYIIARPPKITFLDLSQAAIRLELAEKDKEALKIGTATVLHEDYSASSMLINGLEIEESQRYLMIKYGSLTWHTLELTCTKLIERSNTLQCKINTWRGIQQLFMPSVVSLQDQTGPSCSHTIYLFLPSSACIRTSVPHILLEHEWQLRYAQAHNTLASLCARLEVRAHMYQYKDRFVCGQHKGTRSNSLLQSVEAKKHLDIIRYRAVFAALEVLSAALNKTNWRGSLKKLRDEDVDHVSSGDGSGSEGRRELSWIWLTGGGSGVTLQTEAGQENIDTSLRECNLLQEEMCRILAYHEWHSLWWEGQVGRNINFNDRPGYQEGADAYVFRQASIRTCSHHFC
ncbi:hypothetical protein C8Q80DRAFT_1222396 [Daedaleopsis nitida]|nr:hypothetical protein C8Q80DRAFT_1222396 [Daedaleopsis nitida]